jgi:hypothetical protein
VISINDNIYLITLNLIICPLMSSLCCDEEEAKRDDDVCMLTRQTQTNQTKDSSAVMQRGQNVTIETEKNKLN